MIKTLKDWAKDMKSSFKAILLAPNIVEKNYELKANEFMEKGN